MRRLLLGSLCGVWIAMLLACTGAGGKWIDLPDGKSISRSDDWDYYFDGKAGVPGVGGHITDVGFDDRFILLRRDVSRHVRRRRWNGRLRRDYELTGVVEYYIVELGTPKRHGPLTEAEFAAARGRLGVPAGLTLEPTDKVRARVGPPRE
jgi:hypothetical protein